MDKYKISKNYASSMFSVAKKNNKVTEIYQEIKLVEKIYSSSDKIKEVEQVLNKNNNHKVNFLKNILKNTSINSLVRNFLLLIITNKRLKHITNIRKNYEKLIDKSENVLRCVLTSKYIIDNTQKENLQNLLSKKLKKHIVLENIINKDIIGGFIIKIEDIILDFSYKKRIKKILDKGLSSFFNYKKLR